MHINSYVNFCTHYYYDVFPVDSLQARRYLQYLSYFHKTVDSSKGYVSGMRSLHEIFRFEPPEGDYLYHLTVNGIRRDKAHVVKQAAPLTPEILVGMYGRVDFRCGVQVATWTALLIGFYLLLRKSNLVPDSAVGFDCTKQLA